MPTVLMTMAMISKLLTMVTAQAPHVAVLENDAQEALLPHEYRNPFLKMPRIRALLSRSSWFGPGEHQVCYYCIPRHLNHLIYDYVSCSANI